MHTAAIGKLGPALIFDHTERTGQLTITLSNEALRKLAAGQAVDFSGQAASTNGNQSTVQGTATPAAGGSRDTGAIRVRIDSKKGKLVFKTTYHLVK